jgi:hypothetical protein
VGARASTYTICLGSNCFRPGCLMIECLH